MRYAHSVIKKALCTLAIAAPLSLALALPAHAATYPTDVQALELVQCNFDNFELNFTGLQPGSKVKVSVKFDSKPAVVTEENAVAGGPGGTYTYSYSLPYPAGTNKVVWSAQWVAADGSGGIPKDSKNLTDASQPGTFFRKNCPDLPVTGGNAAPIGKIALGAVLAGGLLATVAIRRRPRKAQPAV